MNRVASEHKINYLNSCENKLENYIIKKILPKKIK